MSSANRVLGPGSALVDGKSTGLAHCSRQDCRRPCLRRDPALTLVDMTRETPDDWRLCHRFIPDGLGA